MSVSEQRGEVPATSVEPTRSPALSEEEQAVARRLSGGFGWPTVLLTVVLLSVEV